MRRSLLAAAVAAALLTHQNVDALGLGEAEVQSFLNQPLRVRIPLTVESDDERESLRVALAAPEDFRRVGLDRAALGVVMEVDVQQNGQDLFIILTSQDSIRDPFLQILLNADWSSGRMLRQYTLFLDPPLLETPSIQVRSAPQQSTPAPASVSSARPAAQRQREPAQSEPASTSTSSSTARDRYEGDEYGPVESGETLWSIASRTHPESDDYTINQVMLAYVRLNPESFDRGNVNSLHRGARLRVPKSDDIAVVNAREALRMVQQQHSQWRSNNSNRSRGGDDFSSANDDSDIDDGNSAASIPDGRLQLVPPEESSGEISNTAGMQAELSRLEEELLTARMENADLSGQINALRNEIERLEGLGVQDRELAQFQQYLNEDDETDDGQDDAYVDPFVNDGLTDNGQPADPLDDDGFGAEDSDGEIGGGVDGASDGLAAIDGVGTDAAAITTAEAGGTDRPLNNPALNTTPEEDGSPVTLTMMVIAGTGALAIGFLIWLQRRRDPGKIKTKADKPAKKTGFSAKKLLKTRAAKKTDKPKKGGLADRLVSANRTTQVSKPVPPPPITEKPVVPPPPPLGSAASPPAEASPSTRDAADDKLARSEPAFFAEEDGLNPSLDQPADSGAESRPPMTGDDQESAAEDEGLPFDVAAEDLLRRLADDDDEDQATESGGDNDASASGDKGLEFDLSGMEHLLDGDEDSASDETELLADGATSSEEDAYQSVLRMASEDEDGELGAAPVDDEPLADGPDEDEVEIKLDLARAYISMGDNEAAGTILDEILGEGSDAQRAEARNLMKQL